MGKIVSIGTTLTHKAITRDLKEISRLQSEYREFSQRKRDELYMRRSEAMEAATKAMLTYGWDSPEHQAARELEGSYFKGGEYFNAIENEIAAAFKELLDKHDAANYRWGIKR